ncbi:MAG: ABC transporter ATP-binding protein [Planctomycetota bacterium]
MSQEEPRNAPSPALAPFPPAPDRAGSQGPARDPVPAAPLPPRAAALVVDGLSKTYEDTQAVRDLSFEVFGGEILGLVGPNGAGKTTTLRSICGVLPLQHGDVSICGISIAREEARAKSKLAWIPDDPEPFDSLTVHEHLRFTAALYGVADWEPRAEELLSRFELQEKRDALGGELSRGMRQKLALCCAWIHSPEVVLMDEPLSGLDPRGIRAAKAAIRDLAAQGAAVILSSHLLVLIEELADRILIVDRGRKIFVGTMDEARATLSAPAGSSLEEIFMAATEGARSKEGAPAPAPPVSPPPSGT